MLGHRKYPQGPAPGCCPSDGELWARSGKGDAEAFALLFQRHAKAVYNYCFRRTGEWATAEDLTSIVFLEAWRQRGKSLPADKVRAWLLGIATFALHHRWRAERRHRSALERIRHDREVADLSLDIEDRIDDQGVMQALLAEVRRLPRHYQDVIVLCCWAGLSYEEAAVALGVPVGTVRSRLSRARTRLRELRGSSEPYNEIVEIVDGDQLRERVTFKSA